MSILKSSDHVEAILSVVNGGTWAKDAIWAYHKDSLDYDQVALPDRSYHSGGFIVIEQGRKGLVPNGKKLYQSEEDFWQVVAKHFSHWPRLPFRKTQWTREYRRKDGNAIVRRFNLSIHPIYAITREVANEIVSIGFYCRGWDGEEHPDDRLIYKWDIPHKE